MNKPRWVFVSVLAAAAIGAAVFGHSSLDASASGPSVHICTGGSITGGTYPWVVVNGVCSIDAGSVTVEHNLMIEPGGELLAAFGGSDLHVQGSLSVLGGGVLVLGCEPEAFICFNDPDQDVGTMMTNDVIDGNLEALGALTVITHHTTIAHNVIQVGGGGGLNCDPRDELQGSPAYATYEDNSVGGSLLVDNWRSCWFGIFRNSVGGNVALIDNQTADPDGNEVATNTITGRLTCVANLPAPNFGDSQGAFNTVGHGTSGQCRAVVAP